jgi:Family of unknown function (DUF6572)
MPAWVPSTLREEPTRGVTSMIMGLENAQVVDAVGIEKSTGDLILTILDGWPWDDERAHLQALQAKFNAYLDFVESGQLWEECPDAGSRLVVIDVIFRFPPPELALELLEKAADVAAELDIRVRSRVVP